MATERPVATVLAAKNIRPDYVSGDSFRYLVITGGKVAALAKTADEAARHAGPSARHADLGDACVGPGFIDTHIHALQAAADVRLVSLREATTLDGLLSAVREAGLGRTADDVDGDRPQLARVMATRGPPANHGPTSTRSAFPGRSWCGAAATSPSRTPARSHCWGRRHCRAAPRRPGRFTPTR